MNKPSDHHSAEKIAQKKLTEPQIDGQLSQDYLHALFDFVIKINQIDSISEIIWHLAQHTIKSFGFEDCVIYLLDEDQKTLRQVAAYGPKCPYRETLLNPISLQLGEGIVGKSAITLKPILIKDTRNEPAYIVDDQRRLSELAVPITFKNQLLGVIDSENSNVDFFTDSHQRSLEILASVLASKLSFENNIQALENLIEALEESKTLTENYLEISNLTYNSRSEKELYLSIHRLIANQVRTQSFFIVLYDRNEHHYSFPFVQDEFISTKFDFSMKQSKINKSLIADVIQSQQPMLANFEELKIHIRNDRLLDKTHVPFSWLAVPFEISENLFGAIALKSYDPTIQFSEKDKLFLTFLAQHISSAIERKFKDQKLQHQALHDQVTGLSNRTLFLDRIEHAFKLSKRQSLHDLAVLFIDLDDFKLINDKYGHQVGDRLLKAIAEIMQSQLRDSDTLSRLGGDEFAILLESVESTTKPIKIANRILEAFKKPIKVGEHLINATISIGISFKDDNTSNAESLLKNADHAMYHAKKLGKNCCQVYEAALHQARLYERQLIQELHQAIENKELIFYYQPIVELASQKVIGFEALMRWMHPVKGLITPDHFIPVAEQNNLMKAIDAQLLTTVAAQLKQWQELCNEPLYISLNLSAQRFTDTQLIKEIKLVLKKYQLPPGALVVEVTEHVLMENIGKARHLFHQLKALGIRISLDDFGTGYSSLSYLNQLPFDILKIDRSFVTNITQRTPDHPIINMIVALAKTMKIELVAEGIETLLQFETLTEMACRFGQGYYFAKPLCSQDAQQLVITRNLKMDEKTINSIETSD